MKYIVYKRIKENVLCEEVNISRGTEAEDNGSIIFVKDKPVCYIGSEVFKQHFVSNEDENGEERGKIIEQIKKKLSSDDKLWGRVVDDEICKKYDSGDDNFFIWNKELNLAEIEDLQHILNLLKG